jgi:LytS/YehU family sensor histidine kinase
MFLTTSVTFLFLLFAWITNSLLTNSFQDKKDTKNQVRKALFVFLANALLLSLFIIAGIFVLNEFGDDGPRNSFSLWLIAFKGGISIALIYIIQYALNSAEKAQSVSLQNEMLKTENVRAQFEILRQQVNPHFLFNSLSTLRSMVRAKDPKAEEFVLHLSEIYRQLLAKRQFDTVTLKEELEFVNDYSFMLSSRFGAALKIATDIPDENRSFRLPTFSLQLLLENCIKHNVISAEKPLEIKLFASPGFVTVENRLQPKQTEAEHSGYGLENLIQRYKLLGFAESGVFVFSDNDVFRVRLKLLEQ